MKKIILKKNREKSVLRKHPWIFSGAIENENKNLVSGDEVEIFSFDGKWLAKGIYSSQSQIRVRIFSFEKEESLNKEVIRKKIVSAITLRNKFISSQTNASRLFFSESDGIPGLIVDKYDKILVCMFLSVSAERFRKEILEILIEELNPETIFERSDSEAREKEGLEIKSELLFGNEPPDFVQVLENNYKFFVDIKNGHKTGFYLDQRENRLKLGKYSSDKEILNCFSYTGGFSVYALANKAKHIVNVDASLDSLKLAEKNFLINNISESKYENINADVFKLLREYASNKKTFDIVILDPPKFATSKSNIEKAARGYKDINFYALKIIRSGGLLFSFSCSGLISPELFQKIIADAALDAGRNVRFVDYLKQASDHPVSANFPESLYLKGFVAYVE